MVTTEQFPLGSRWYVTGQHVRVVAHGRRDGEPAVIVRGERPPSKWDASIMVRLFARHAVPSGASS